MTTESSPSPRTPDGGAWLRSGDRTECRSIDELAALWPGARFSSTVADFYANALRLQFGRFRIEAILNSAFSCERDQGLIDLHPRPGVSIEIVLEGRQRRRQGGIEHLQGPGQVSVTALDIPFAFTWLGAGRSVRTVTPVAVLPSQLQESGSVRPGLLPDTPLLQSYVAFVNRLVDVAQPDSVEHSALEASARYLHTAVLLEAQHPEPGTAPGLRSRIEEHIALHLTDPTLSPRSIAAALSVSVRSVHGAFNDPGITVAAEIRRQRVMAATVLLQEVDPPLSQAVIAERVGFRGKDQLGRSLQRVLGVNATGYRAQ